MGTYMLRRLVALVSTLSFASLIVLVTVRLPVTLALGCSP